MFLVQGIFAGIIATIFFDLFQSALFYAYNINKSKWNLIGRYFYGLKKGKFFRENIENEVIIKNELFLGYLTHYIIGSIFGLIYINKLIISLIIFCTPFFSHRLLSP